MSNRVEAAKEDNSTYGLSLSRIVSKKHPLYHIFNFIEENYGNNPEKIIKAFGTILDFEKGIRALITSKKKFTFRNSLNLLKYTLPSSLAAVEMAMKITRYARLAQKGEVSEYEKREIEVCKILDVSVTTARDIWRRKYLNEDILTWLLRSPKTKGYKILSYYNSSLEKLDKVPNELEDTSILFEYEGNKLLLRVSIKTFAGTKYIENMIFTGQYPTFTSDRVQEFELLLLKNFILTFNIKENILEFKGGITSKKRAVVEEKINQFDVHPLIAEIRKVLKSGRSRGHGFIGKQGTGKSIIMRKIEELLTDITIIRLTPEEFNSPRDIKRCFGLIKTIQPAVVIIEDMDSYGFKDKNDRVCTFINEMDAEDLNAVFLVTINDTDLIHKTILDRPGRFDEIHRIDPPSTKEEAYEVMLSKYNKLTISYTDFNGVSFPKLNEIKDEVYNSCLRGNFTQAEITSGIIEKVFINIDDPSTICFNTAIMDAVTSFTTSKESLNSYSFYENENPYNDPECVEEEIRTKDNDF